MKTSWLERAREQSLCEERRGRRGRALGREARPTPGEPAVNLCLYPEEVWVLGGPWALRELGVRTRMSKFKSQFHVLLRPDAHPPPCFFICKLGVLAPTSQLVMPL